MVPRPIRTTRSSDPSIRWARESSATSRLRRRALQLPLLAHLAALAGCRLVRDHLREFHRLGWSPALRTRTDRRAISGRDARRVALDWQHRSARLRILGKAETSRARDQ